MTPTPTFITYIGEITLTLGGEDQVNKTKDDMVVMVIIGVKHLAITKVTTTIDYILLIVNRKPSPRNNDAQKNKEVEDPSKMKNKRWHRTKHHATSDVFKNGVSEKMKDPGSFTVPYSISGVDLGHALCDLRDYYEDKVFVELFSSQVFFEDEDPKGLLVEINVVYDARKFEPLDLQTKDEKKNKPLIEESLEL
ncbi:uncharacterized protein E5676_scaffold111G00440 [Cucumis melo var. makuwa]|uniref:Uncharacterized protein n=1 Tax=Cucumis melo var. makuwa TaxID=1194695 RepID=A0A5D3DR87_CUCMM|nr:uncharacterized protein E6C27_scaffold54G001440 [Cucumis melo var. makuwa]TYK26126.1 uncharacterized protein E5676_scaffold111G00440 [Cucumis melo var. makuwa]